LLGAAAAGTMIAAALFLGRHFLASASSTSPQTAISPPSVTVPSGALDKPAPARTAAEHTKNATYLSSGYEELVARLRVAHRGNEDLLLGDLSEIAKTRPALAIDLALALGRSDEEKASWVTGLTKQWADRAPQAAWDWLSHQTHRMEQLANGSLPSVVLDAMGAQDPDLLLRNVDASLRLGETPGVIAPAIVVHLGLEALVKSGHVEEARHAVEGWLTGPLRNSIEASAFETVAVGLSEKSPETAGLWLKSLPASEDRNRALSMLASHWADHDPEAALKWAQELGVQEGRSVALERTFSEWVERNAGEAGNWLGNYLLNMPDDPEADRLIGNLLTFSSTLKQNSALALHWASLIGDPQQRQAYTEREALRWGRRDPAAAVEYVQTTPTLSPEQKAQLVQKIQTQPSGNKDDIEE
jgi:hypothetical protein